MDGRGRWHPWNSQSVESSCLAAETPPWARELCAQPVTKFRDPILFAPVTNESDN
jgi:hypothetical protein